jgi:oligopeptide transport system substrate-binding protein
MEVDLNIISTARLQSPMRIAGAAAAILLTIAACSVFEPKGPVRIAAIGTLQMDVTPTKGPLSLPSATYLDATAQGLVSFDADGQIEPGLAERWTVTTDGRSYIFRIREAKWPNGRKVTAQQVATILQSYLRPSSRHPLKDDFSEVEDIHAMTDSVVEIRLRLPQPMLLELLAQPSMAMVASRPARASDKGSNGGWDRGWGPMRVQPRGKALVFYPAPDPLDDEADGPRHPDADENSHRTVEMVGVTAPRALARFKNGNADAVIGGRFSSLPYFHSTGIARSRLLVDPTSGLFGLAFQTTDGFWAVPEHRMALSSIIRRDRLIEAFGITDWTSQISLRPPVAERSGLPPPALPIWANEDDSARLGHMQRLIAQWTGLGRDIAPLRIALPDSPGATILFGYIASDLSRAGLEVQRVAANAAPDLTLIDEVAPNDDIIWPLRRLSCRRDTLCNTAIHDHIALANNETDNLQRLTLIADAEADMLREASFIPLASPLRWSVANLRFTGIRPNARAHHPLNRMISETK